MTLEKDSESNRKVFFNIFLEITSGKPVKGKELTACWIDFDNDIFWTPNSKMNRRLYIHLINKGWVF